MRDADLVEWDGSSMIYSEDVSGPQEGYFASPDEFADYCEEEDIATPEFAFACTARTLELNLRQCLDAAEAAMEWNPDEFGTIHYYGMAKLEGAVWAFNEANKHVRTYEADYTRKIRITKGSKDE